MQRYLASLLIGAGLFAGCAGVEPADIRDLRELPQDPLAYVAAGDLDRPLIDAATQQHLYQQFRQQWLAAWDPNAARPSPESVQKHFLDYAAKPGYGENLLPHSPDFARKLASLARIDNCDQPAITVVNTSLRQMPTQRPRFDEVGKPGEGFPFDSLQESSLCAGTPVRLWLVSSDRQWGLVSSPCGQGWVLLRDVAAVDAATIELYRTAPLVCLMRDGMVVGLPPWGQVAIQTHIGAVFPLKNIDKYGLHVLVPVYQSARCTMVTATVGPEDAAVMPLPATPRTVATLAGQMIGQPYGWGGMFDSRDCSSTTRDLMIPLGVPLPRNSSDQARAYAAIDLKDLPPQQREQVLLDKGVPFATLVRFPGHIALYVGQRGGRALILHNTWGVKTRRGGVEGRKLIGRCVVTTLQPGEELRDLDRTKGDLRARMECLVQIGQRSQVK